MAIKIIDTSNSRIKLFKRLEKNTKFCGFVHPMHPLCYSTDTCLCEYIYIITYVIFLNENFFVIDFIKNQIFLLIDIEANFYYT